MGRRRITKLDDACMALLEVRAAKKASAAGFRAEENRAVERVQRALEDRELESYAFVDGERTFIATAESKDVVRIIELKPKRKRKPPADEEQLKEQG